MNNNRQGYTLIEVILFLAITGLVMVVLLIGWGSALNQRRYQDATTSLASYIQNQYNLMANVNSSRDATEVCAGGKILVDETGTVGRGKSDCTIVGRMLWSFSSADGTSGIKVRQVIATTDATLLPLNPDDSDVQVLRDAKLTTALQEEEYRPEWGTRLIAPGTTDPERFTLLIVRTPTTGVVHTYRLNEVVSSPDDVVRAADNSGDLKLCLDPAGLLGASTQPTGALITQDATNTSGVQFIAQGGC